MVRARLSRRRRPSAHRTRGRDGLRARLLPRIHQPVHRPQDRAVPRRGDHRRHPLVLDLEHAPACGRRQDADVDPREQLHAVVRVVRRLRDGGDDHHGDPRLAPAIDDEDGHPRQEPAVVDGRAVDARARRPRGDARDPDEAEHDQPRAAQVPRRDGGRGDAAEPVQRGTRGAREGTRALRFGGDRRARSTTHRPRGVEDHRREGERGEDLVAPRLLRHLRLVPQIHANGKSYAWSDWTMRFDHSFLVLGAG